MASNTPSRKTWNVEWQDGMLIDFYGAPTRPIYINRPDPLVAHELVDMWASKFRLTECFPHIEGHSLWWFFRFRLHMSLINILPQIRLLCKLKRDIPIELSDIVIKRPPESWWPALFRLAFPSVTIEVQSVPKIGKLTKIERHYIRAKRAWKSVRNFRHALKGTSVDRRILVLSRDRLWNGEKDLELGTVMESLRECNLDPVIIARATACGMRVKKRSLYTRPANHLFDDQIAFRYLFRHGMPKAHNPVLPDAGFEMDGLDLTQLISSMMHSIVPFAYKELVMYSQSVVDLMRKIQPRAVVLTDENNGNYALNLGLKKAGIPMIAVQHGVIHDDHMSYSFPTGTNPANIPLCDKTCVYGQSDKDVLVNRSIYPDNSVVITGQTQMDSRIDAAQRSWGKRSSSGVKLREVTLPPGKDRLLLFCSQYAYRAFVGERLLKEFDGINERNFLVIRPHPMEAPQPFWDNMIRKYVEPNRVLVQCEGSLDEWLDACDVHISATSTVLSEATIFGRPNIVVCGKELGDWTCCVADNAAVLLDDFSSLDDALDYWLDNVESKREKFEKIRQAYIEKHFYRLDGRSGQRVASAVEQVIRKQGIKAPGN